MTFAWVFQFLGDFLWLPIPGKKSRYIDYFELCFHLFWALAHICMNQQRVICYENRIFCFCIGMEVCTLYIANLLFVLEAVLLLVDVEVAFLYYPCGTAIHYIHANKQMCSIHEWDILYGSGLWWLNHQSSVLFLLCSVWQNRPKESDRKQKRK